MRRLGWFFLYTYIGLVILAGFWGAFISPAFDFRFLFSLDPALLGTFERVNLISQYRFLRAIELGFGVFALLFQYEIFHDKKFNQLFLFIMFSGILARIVSFFAEGIPSSLFLFFLIYEGVGWMVIYRFSRSTLNCYGKVQH